ncbi:hypothetical protein Bhyg_09593 [Pseudolycoriella hygida]|uniref:Uncharacterized protein n=1 Tax=Pseudolycoriella hygida TaxID=35572 RepID=A0A9Q0S4J2_9DIPT|nr:hypothetical protein Bhyg_09593 [Pseudolycoriella hygida]
MTSVDFSGISNKKLRLRRQEYEAAMGWRNFDFRIVKAAETTPTISNNLIPCPHCPITTRKSFRGQRGLKIHISKRHADLTVKAPDSQTEPMPLGDQLAQLKASNRLLLRIPKSARKSVAEQLANTVDNVVKRNDTESWNDLFLFAYKVLRGSAKVSKSEWKTKVSTF